MNTLITQSNLTNHQFKRWYRLKVIKNLIYWGFKRLMLHLKKIFKFFYRLSIFIVCYLLKYLKKYLPYSLKLILKKLFLNNKKIYRILLHIKKCSKNNYINIKFIDRVLVFILLIFSIPLFRIIERKKHLKQEIYKKLHIIQPIKKNTIQLQEYEKKSNSIFFLSKTEQLIYRRLLIAISRHNNLINYENSH